MKLPKAPRDYGKAGHPDQVRGGYPALGVGPWMGGPALISSGACSLQGAKATSLGRSTGGE